MDLINVERILLRTAIGKVSENCSSFNANIYREDSKETLWLVFTFKTICDILIKIAVSFLEKVS